MLCTKDECRLHQSRAANSTANTLDEHTADLIHPGVAAWPYTETVTPVSKWRSCMITACARGEERCREITASHAKLKLVASCAIALAEIARF